MLRSLALTALFALMNAVAFGQSATGVLDGRITDTAGGVIPGAKVTILNSDTGVRQALTSNGEGRFYQNFVQPGNYSVTVEMKGFNRHVENSIRVDIEQTVTLPIVLKAGDVATTVEVTASGAHLSTESSTVSTVIGTRAIVDLPLNGRNPLSLATLAPGVIPGGGGSTPWISGGRNATNEITIDGTSVILPENNVSNLQTGYTPIEDSVAEFSLVTNALAAEYGRTGGGVINVATRGGTNRVHFSAYDFLRNSDLDTNTWSNNRNGVKLAAFQRNQFGGTVGGPITLPKIYNGANRTFFFFSYQSTLSRQGTQSSATVPIQSWLNGDFSNLKNGAGQPIVIYDPLTAADNGTGTYVRQAFPGNIIPANRFDPVALNIAKYFPASNAVATNAFTNQNNFFASGKSPSNDNKLDSRVDHNFSDKFRLYARGSYDTSRGTPLNGYGNAGTSIGDGINNSQQYNITTNGIYTFTPSTVLSFNYGFARNVSIRYPFSEGTTPASLGFPTALSAVAGINNYEFPNITFGGNTNISNLGQSTYTTLKNTPTSHNLRADLSKVAGKHSLKLGGEWRKLFLNFTQFGQPDGQYNFSSSYTQQTVGASSSTTQGNGFASFLLGIPGSGSITHSFDAATASAYAGFYAQDDWKITSKLTVNLGLRWDVDTPRTERYNRLSYFDPSAPSPIAGSVASSAICPSCGTLKGAMKFVTADNRHQTPTDLNNWGPRIGFAYNFLPKTVLRGGYGILYSPSVMQAAGTSGSAGTEGFQSTTNMQVSYDNGRTIAAYLRNPFPNGFNLPTGTSAGAATDLGLTVQDSFFSDYQNPMVQQWNANVQQELKGNWIVTVGYLGSKGNHLIDGESSMNYDQLPGSYLALNTRLVQSVPNPFYGIITTPNSVFAQPTILARYLLSPYPQYTGLNAYRKPAANSIYHSLTISAEHRFSKGFQTLISFTGGKLIDDSSQVVNYLGASGAKQDFYNRAADRSVSAQDVSKRLVVSGTYELPVGKGRAFLASAPKAVNLVLGGWQLNGIATFSKGTPLQISNGGNNTNIGAANQRPNNNGTSAAKSGAIADRLTSYFNQSVFSQAPAYTFGNVGRFLPDVRGPGIHNLDASLFKNFHLTETFNLQLRAEAFNFTNSPTWNSPGTNVTDLANFGIITGASGQRQIQLAIKINY